MKESGSVLCRREEAYRLNNKNLSQFQPDILTTRINNRQPDVRMNEQAAGYSDGDHPEDVSEEELREIFNVFDVNGDGSNSAFDCHNASSTLLEDEWTDEETQETYEMIGEVDEDGDGKINCK